ncbi:hypothetical protein [Streptomyces sp. NPDC088727]|uniref:hypothetical protein n=1 Tax=Streptomyces sp. NPDC088727 TaxID=3365875 RepID=UPI00380D80DC
MRVTAAQINKAVAHIADATNGEYKVTTGGSNTGRPGNTWAANAEQTIFDSARGENRDALAFFLGVMKGYGILAEKWVEAWSDLALDFDGTGTWFERGQVEASRHKKFEAAKKERARLRAAEDDKATMRNDSLPIEERRAAFRRHNRRGNPFHEGTPAGTEG